MITFADQILLENSPQWHLLSDYVWSWSWMYVYALKQCIVFSVLDDHFVILQEEEPAINSSDLVSGRKRSGGEDGGDLADDDVPGKRVKTNVLEEPKKELDGGNTISKDDTVFFVCVMH